MSDFICTLKTDNFYCDCCDGELCQRYKDYQQGRADEQLQSIEDAKMQATEYLDALDKAKEEAYQQGYADALKELKQKQSIIIDEDGIMHKVVYLNVLEKMQKKGIENDI